MKKCGKCEETKELSEFYSHPTGAKGVSHQCKTCHKTSSIEYRKSSPERQATYAARRKEAKEGEVKTALIPRRKPVLAAEASTKSLTSNDIDLMRDLREEYGIPYKEIASKFEVTREVAYKVCNYEWRANG